MNELLFRMGGVFFDDDAATESSLGAFFQMIPRCFRLELLILSTFACNRLSNAVFSFNPSISTNPEIMKVLHLATGIPRQ